MLLSLFPSLVGFRRVGGHLDQLGISAGDTLLHAAGHAAVGGGVVVYRDDAIAGPVLQVGAVEALQHQMCIKPSRNNRKPSWAKLWSALAWLTLS